MTTYTARATRTGDWWAIDIPELDGVYTQARRLDQVEAMARDAIAIVLEVDPDSFEMTIEPVLPAEAQRIVDELKASRAAADLAANLAALRAKMVAVVLHDHEHLPFRDIGEVLGLSYQRAHQLISGAELKELADQIATVESRLDEIRTLAEPVDRFRALAQSAGASLGAVKKTAAPRKMPAKKKTPQNA